MGQRQEARHLFDGGRARSFVTAMTKKPLPVLSVFLLVALYIYFLGTPLVSRATGISPRAISLIAGFAVFLLGAAVMIAAGITARRGR